jgi:parallel beta-helix repeat protein
MRKVILLILLGLSMISISCGSGSNDSSSDTTTVIINLGDKNSSSSMRTGDVSSSSIPSSVTSIRVTVSADDMVTIQKTVSVAGKSSVSITLEIPNGPNRHILVEALNASGSVLYSGETVVSVGGQSLELTINLEYAYPCELFVDLAGTDNSDCTDPDNPCKTITYALQQTTGNVSICIGEGTFSISTGETFPLVLKEGIKLKCQGVNHSSVIDGGVSDVIQGAPNASIEGCTISGTPAIDDNGDPITVNNCIIDGPGGAGVLLSADSTVMNSIIRNYNGEGHYAIRISGGNSTLSGNTISGNFDGVRITGGNPALSNNTINNNNNTGIYISGSANPVITNNTINNNGSFGVYISSVGSPTPTFSGNTLTGNNYGIRIDGGTPIISGNILSCNTSSDLYYNLQIPTLDVSNNMWDHDPPITDTGCQGQGEDICDRYGSVTFSTSSLAPSPCD